jgi:hypothetical protein
MAGAGKGGAEQACRQQNSRGMLDLNNHTYLLVLG